MCQNRASQTRLCRRGFGDAFHVVHVKEKCLMSFERYSLVQVIMEVTVCNNFASFDSMHMARSDTNAWK